MSDIVLRVENLYKRYRLGAVGAASFGEDLQRLWAKIRGKHDPFEQYISANELSTIKSSQEMQTLKARYVWALQDINFEVKQGEILGIIGKNGAGKSTLLKILSKTTAPTRGEVKIKGRVASLLEVGTGFHPELTGRENIFLNGHILGMNRHEIRAHLDEIIDFAGVEAYLDTPVKRYSSGMYVRLAFAVAAHLLSDILIVDEVLAVGDAEFQKKCIGKMKDVSAGEGRTVLFVSHSMQAVRGLCNRGLLIRNGHLQLDGAISDVVENYLQSDLTQAGSGSISLPTDEQKLFQVLRVATTNHKNVVKDLFSCEEDIVIQLHCRSRQPISRLYGYLTLSKQDGTVVWESDSMDTGNNRFHNLPIGDHTFRITIPKRTLAAGEYILYLSFTSPHAATFIIDCPMYVLRFNLTDEFTDRGNRRNGFFSTLLDWQLESSISV
jgi:lipopolysaccharide transport system ATP-binding protein